MARRDWKLATNDLSILFFGIQDAALMAENMVIAAESLGLGSCFLGGPPYRMVELEDGRPERYAYNTYSWTEHMSRKWG